MSAKNASSRSGSAVIAAGSANAVAPTARACASADARRVARGDPAPATDAAAAAHAAASLAGCGCGCARGAADAAATVSPRSCCLAAATAFARLARFAAWHASMRAAGTPLGSTRQGPGVAAGAAAVAGKTDGF
eukprot:298332-Chlamydomonas_euryale.AAC.1